MSQFRWVVAGGDACPTCTGRNGQVRRDWGADFPAHPNCQCQLVEEESDDDDGMLGSLRRVGRGGR